RVPSVLGVSESARPGNWPRLGPVQTRWSCGDQSATANSMLPSGDLKSRFAVAIGQRRRNDGDSAVVLVSRAELHRQVGNRFDQDNSLRSMQAQECIRKRAPVGSGIDYLSIINPGQVPEIAIGT